MTSQMIAGHQVWVHEQGDGPDTRLFLHCSLAKHETLLPLNALLPPARSIFFDLPGHGRSAPWSSDGDYQQEVARIAAALLTGPAHVIGHSFGATVALHLALFFPEKVARLTLIEPVFFAAARGTQAYIDSHALFSPFEDAIKAGDLAKAAEVFIDRWGAPGGWKMMSPDQQKAAAKRIHLIPETNAAMIDDCHDQLTAGRLEALSIPISLIDGTQSTPVIKAISDALEGRLANVVWTRVDGAGHMAPITHVAEVAAAV